MDEKLFKKMCYKWIKEDKDDSHYKRLKWLSENGRKHRIRTKNLNRLKMHPKYKIFKMIEDKIKSELMWYKKEMLFCLRKKEGNIYDKTRWNNYI